MTSTSTNGAPVGARPSLPECKKLVDCLMWRARRGLRALHLAYREFMPEAAPAATHPAKTASPTWEALLATRAARVARVESDRLALEDFKRDFSAAFVAALGCAPECVDVHFPAAVRQNVLDVFIDLSLPDTGEYVGRVSAEIVPSGEGWQVYIEGARQRAIPLEPGYAELIAALITHAHDRLRSAPTEELFPRRENG